jgi:hypothetical protein
MSGRLRYLRSSTIAGVQEEPHCIKPRDGSGGMRCAASPYACYD